MGVRSGLVGVFGMFEVPVSEAPVATRSTVPLTRKSMAATVPLTRESAGATVFRVAELGRTKVSAVMCGRVSLAGGYREVELLG